MSIHWHHLQASEVLSKLNSNAQQGLSSQKVADLQKILGLNELQQTKTRSYFSIVMHQFLSPLIYLLLVAAAIAFALDDYKDVVVILTVVVLNAIIGAIQEGRAEQSLLSLRKLFNLKTRVIRDGQEIEIEAKHLVPGDIYMVAAGDSVPTDGRLVEAKNLMVAEAALTGESVPVAKGEQSLAERTSLAEQTNMIFAGTHITAGRGVAVAVATGHENQIGKVAKLATETAQPKTQLELRVHQFGKNLALAAIVLFFVVLGVGYLRGVEFSQIIMISVSQMVSLVPEGLAVALTIALAVGVQRMAKKRTVVRRLSAVEGLGSTSVICTDKTGTLTKNEMTVVALWLSQTKRLIQVSGVGYLTQGEFRDANQKQSLSASAIKQDLALHELLIAGVCCNDAQVSILGDPTEIALVVLAEKAGLSSQQIRDERPRRAEIPFDSASKLMATEHLYQDQPVIFIKGAPEALLRLCQLSSVELNQAREQAELMASDSMRVLAVGAVYGKTLNPQMGYEALQGEVQLLGLLGQIDPPREEVAQAVFECRQAGIRPIMVTGDHKATGLAIARTLGITQEGDLAIDGQELENMTDDELSHKIDQVSVFARVHPEQKLRIVKALQQKGEIVAMTGDGVNDAPALVQANIGVAMGVTGTEVAKEAAKIIITDDNFSTIVSAVAEGRLVYQNIKKLVLFLFVTSLDEVIILLLALLAGYPPPLAAVQILWINLVSEGALTVNLIMEPLEGDEMQRKPIPVDEPLLDRSLLRRMPLMMFGSVLSTFGWFLYRTHTGVAPELVQTETFTVLVVCQWFNVLNCRSATHSALSWDLFKNHWLVGGLVLANIMHFLVIYWRPLGDFFHTVPIGLHEFFVIGLVASLVLWLEEMRKWMARRKLRQMRGVHA